MIRTRNETEDLLLSITKNCETLIKQTHTKPEETLKFKENKPRETFLFNQPITIKGGWMLGLTSLEVYISIFNITEENIKVELYTDPLEFEFSYTELEDKVAEVRGLSDISFEHLSHEILGPDVFESYRKLSIEKSETGGYYNLLKKYLQTQIREIEIYLRILIGLYKDHIQLISKQ